MKTSNYIFAIMAIVIIMLCVIIANCKFKEWEAFKTEQTIEHFSKSYLDALEEETGNLGTAGMKNIMKGIKK